MAGPSPLLLALIPARYEVLPTPLTRLRWWRVVLDEAQMVESGAAAAARMAQKLDTVHRCVTMMVMKMMTTMVNM